MSHLARELAIATRKNAESVNIDRVIDDFCCVLHRCHARSGVAGVRPRPGATPEKAKRGDCRAGTLPTSRLFGAMSLTAEFLSN